MLGNAIWLVLAALILQLLASCTVCFTSRKEKRNRRSNRDLEAPLVGTQRPRRNWYGKKMGPVNYGQTYPPAGAVGQQAPGMMAPGMVQTHQPGLQEKRHFWQKKQTVY